jgi:hypothetical protein
MNIFKMDDILFHNKKHIEISTFFNKKNIIEWRKLSKEQFFLGVFTLSRQYISDKVINFCTSPQFKILKNKLDSGDMVDEHGTNHEFKFTIIDKKKHHVNFLQVRVYQKIPKYVFLVVVIDQEKVNIFTFVLSAEQVKEEKILLHASNTHISKKDSKGNLAIEKSLSLSFTKGHVDYERWINKYLNQNYLKRLSEDTKKSEESIF